MEALALEFHNPLCYSQHKRVREVASSIFISAIFFFVDIHIRAKHSLKMYVLILSLQNK